MPARSAATPTVVIVGAGLTGLSAAYHLARRRVDCLVLEAESVGDGASGRTGGLMLAGTARGILEGTGNSIEVVREIVQRESIDCGLRLPGCWEIEHQLGTGASYLPWTDGGEPIRIARTVVGGVVDPFALLVGLAERAMALGARIQERTRVIRILTDGLHPAVQIGGVSIETRYLIVAANAWIPSLVGTKRNISSELTYACVTERLPPAAVKAIGMEAGIPFYTADQPYLWGRTMDDGGLLIGAGLSGGSPQELEATAIGAGTPRTILDRLEERVHGLHPALSTVAVVKRWAGPIAFAEDMRPLIGYASGRRDLIVAGGYAGHGVALSVWAGELLAAAIAGEKMLPEWGRL